MNKMVIITTELRLSSDQLNQMDKIFSQKKSTAGRPDLSMTKQPMG